MNFRERVLSFVPFIICAFLFCLSFSPLISAICEGILVFIWLINQKYKASRLLILENKILLLPGLFYLLHLVSIFYSSNWQYASLDYQIKLSYLLFPIVLSGFSFSISEIRKFKFYFIGGVVVTSIFYFVYASIRYFESGDTGLFFYSEYSRFMHPGYFTIYLNLAFIFLMENYFLNAEKKKSERVILFLIMFFVFANITLLSARMAWIVAVLTILIYYFILFFKSQIQKREKYISILFVLLMIGFQMGANRFNNKSDSRFKQIEDAIENPSQMTQAPERTYEGESGITARVHLWKNAAELISQNLFFGVGAGDLKEDLIKVYGKNNFAYGIKNNMSPHNQYLHTTVILGVFGLCFLLTMLFMPAVAAFKNQQWIYFLFMVIIVVNCITESILERQSGVMLFAFFNSLFYFQMKFEKSRTNHSL
jgi:O-antigen ligase